VAGLDPKNAGDGGHTVSPVSFERAQAELEQIVERLERGDVELEELTRLWERGEELYRRCAEQLAAAQGRIEELATRLQEGDSG
jgi:exodeoxyribonuclease VII small subunit